MQHYEAAKEDIDPSGGGLSQTRCGTVVSEHLNCPLCNTTDESWALKEHLKFIYFIMISKLWSVNRFNKATNLPLKSGGDPVWALDQGIY